MSRRRRRRNPKVDPAVVAITLGGLAVAGVAIYFLTKKPTTTTTAVTPAQLATAAGV